MRVLVIGHSHCRTLKWACDRAPRRFEVEWAAHDTSLDCRLEDGRLYPPAAKLLFVTQPDATTAGIDLQRFDALVLSGLGMFASRNNHDRAYCQHFLFEHALPGWQPGAVAGMPPMQLVSDAVMRELVAGLVRLNPLHALIPKLAAAFKGPIIVQPFPLPSERTEPNWKVEKVYGERWGVVNSWCYQVAWDVLAAHVNASGPQVRLLSHPSAEWLQQGFHPVAYTSSDVWHGNEAYGALVLDQIEAALGLSAAPAEKIAAAAAP